MADQAIQAKLTIDAGPEVDAEELEQLTRQLRAELLELDVASVDLVKAGEIPEGARAGDPVFWGKLLLTLAASGGVITSLINLLQSWLSRDERRSLTIDIQGDKLELKGIPISPEERQRLLDDWLSRRT